MNSANLGLTRLDEFMSNIDSHQVRLHAFNSFNCCQSELIEKFSLPYFYSYTDVSECPARLSCGST
jgi:hypothetical protein